MYVTITISLSLFRQVTQATSRLEFEDSNRDQALQLAAAEREQARASKMGKIVSHV